MSPAGVVCLRGCVKCVSFTAAYVRVCVCDVYVYVCDDFKYRMNDHDEASE